MFLLGCILGDADFSNLLVVMGQRETIFYSFTTCDVVMTESSPVLNMRSVVSPKISRQSQ